MANFQNLLTTRGDEDTLDEQDYDRSLFDYTVARLKGVFDEHPALGKVTPKEKQKLVLTLADLKTKYPNWE
jgi:hypothetical protein